jgi:hypothetical protein
MAHGPSNSIKPTMTPIISGFATSVLVQSAGHKDRTTISDPQLTRGSLCLLLWVSTRSDKLCSMIRKDQYVTSQLSAMVRTICSCGQLAVMQPGRQTQLSTPRPNERISPGCIKVSRFTLTTETYWSHGASSPRSSICAHAGCWPSHRMLSVGSGDPVLTRPRCATSHCWPIEQVILW